MEPNQIITMSLLVGKVMGVNGGEFDVNQDVLHIFGIASMIFNFFI